MNRGINLTEGNIIKTLTKLALPIMGTSFIQMAYNITDIMWLGRLDTRAVAAAGAGGFFLWLGAAFILISQIGVGVSVAQSYGKGDYLRAKDYITQGLQLDILIAIVYGLSLFFLKSEIIGFFNFDDPVVVTMAESYLSIIGLGIVFHFLNPIFSTAMNSSGNSLSPFKINTIGLAVNIILDPVLIFGFGLGIKGAAIATISSQFIVTFMFLIISRNKGVIFNGIRLFRKLDIRKVKEIIKLGFPPATQTGVHALIGIVLTRIIAEYGAVAVAVQSIGSQIESLSWMTSEGFAAAISAFVGQNYGAKKFDRIKEGYYKGIKLLGYFGIFISFLLIFAAKPIFTMFTPNDQKTIAEGIIYLRILGLSQFFMSIEIGTAGAFNGLGLTLPPTISGVSINLLRIPLAIVLSSGVLGLSGIWWAISATSILKGIILFIWFFFVLKSLVKNKGLIKPFA